MNKSIMNFDEFITESGIGGVNVGGVNFGSDKGDVGSANFGMKGDQSFNKRGAMTTLDNNLIYSELKGDYFSESDIRELLIKYDVWLKQNGETPVDTTDLRTKNLDYILKLIESD